MNRRPFVVLGAGREQGRLATKALEAGDSVLVLDRTPRPTGMPSGVRFETVDLIDVDAVVQIVSRVGAIGVSAGFLETPLPAALAARAALGHPPTVTPNAMRATLSKREMNDVARQLDVPTPSTWRSRAEVPPGIHLLVKPSDRGGQVGTGRVTTQSDLECAIMAARDVSRSGEILIQEWIEGPEINAVGLRADDGTFTCVQSSRKRISQDVAVAVEHAFPPDSADHESKILVLMRRLADELVPDGGALFCQFVIGADGPMLVDLGVRLPGGMMDLVVLHATGLDLIAAERRWASGLSWSVPTVGRRDPCVLVRFLVSDPGPIPSGRQVLPLDSMPQLPPSIRLVDAYSNRAITRPAVDASDRYLVIVASGDEAASIRRDVDQVDDLIRRQVRMWPRS